MSAHHYTQVQMRELRDRRVHTAWIPSEMARVGKVITIDGMTGVWRITERYESKPAEYVEAKAREHKHAFASIEGK